MRGMRHTAEVTADRDTQGVFGSPDIVETIFSKIDDCDIFVADVSAVTTYPVLDSEGIPTDRIKATPNPNVLLELGYAVRVLGWENVICIMNALQLSRPSVTAYLQYEKGVYFPGDADAEKISTGAERQRHYRAVTTLKKNPCEENL